MEFKDGREERYERLIQLYNDQVKEKMRQRCAQEVYNGNMLFHGIETWDQYQDALELNEIKKRKEMGFWRYYFGKHKMHLPS